MGRAHDVTQEDRDAPAAARRWSPTTTGAAALPTYTCDGGTGQQWTPGT
ncbi:hypothetical protein [Streptomyces sp. NPDC007904]|jgi:hypothetical protein